MTFARWPQADPARRQEPAGPPAHRSAGPARRGGTLAALAAAATAAVFLLGSADAATASPSIPSPAGAASAGSRSPSSGDARRQARAVAARVDRLTARSKRELAGFEQAVAALGQQAAAAVAADDAQRRAGRIAAASARREAQRVRAIYIGGAQVVVLTSVLAATSPEDLLRRTETASHVLTGLRAADESTTSAALAAAAGTDAGSRRSAVQAAAAVDAVDAAQARLTEVQTTLAVARRELAALTTLARAEPEAAAAAERLTAAQQAAAEAEAGSAGAVRAAAVPPDYAVLYRSAAATCPGMRWTLLAAVGQVESGHGRNTGPSSAGAIGPMQFMPATFAAYAVDGDGDGRRDAWDPADAVFSAARYLCANGGGAGAAGEQTALFAYNHAQWYVAMVRSVAARLHAG